MAGRPGNAGPLVGTAARRAAAAQAPTVGMALFWAHLSQGRMARDSGALASSPGGGLRPASRGSAKPAAMTPNPASISSTPPFSCGRGGRADPIMGVSPGGARHRPAAAWPAPSGPEVESAPWHLTMSSMAGCNDPARPLRRPGSTAMLKRCRVSPKSRRKRFIFPHRSESSLWSNSGTVSRQQRSRCPNGSWT